MKIPINRIKKVMKASPQWSIAWILTLCLYFIFISVVLFIAFPLRSQKYDGSDSKRNEINRFDIDDSTLGDDEQKLLQRANELPTLSNQSDALRAAFYE